MNICMDSQGLAGLGIRPIAITEPHSWSKTEESRDRIMPVCGQGLRTVGEGKYRLVDAGGYMGMINELRESRDLRPDCAGLLTYSYFENDDTSNRVS